MTTTETGGPTAGSITGSATGSGAEVDVVIVNYKSARQLFNCLRSVHAVAREDKVIVSVTVVNNGDDDDLAQTIESAGGATLLESGSNLGYGTACNRGAAQGSAPFILFLNPDTTIAPEFLKETTRFLADRTHADIGIVGPELTDERGALLRSSSKLPTAVDLLGRSLGLHVLFPRGDYPFLPLAAHATSGPVGQVMGAVLMIRRGLFQTLGGFDERFFLYYEDVDLCARAWALGGSCFYLKSARATHIGRVSSSQDEGMALALYLRSSLTYARLHFGFAAEAVLALSCFTAEFLLRLVQAVLRQRSVGVLRAYGLLIRSLIYRESIAARG